MSGSLFLGDRSFHLYFFYTMFNSISKNIHFLTGLMVLFFTPLLGQEKGYKPFETTLTASLFDMDSIYLGNNNIERNRCKSLMNKAAEKITSRYSLEQIRNANFKTGEDILKIIDSTFTDYCFLFYTQPTKEYKFLTYAFRSIHDSSPYINSDNEYRVFFWAGHKGEKCSLIDCDLYCEIYYGIAEMIGLNIKMCESWHHNYIRFYTPQGNYFCWEAITGKAYKDETGICGYKNVYPEFENQFFEDMTAQDIWLGEVTL